MANPTSNFNWQMPTSSDLVTDLPADFEVFGQAVDTSLADLKGGTTGQVLSKASNTDMDFAWTAGGDITGVTAGVGISGGGTSGTVTVTNSMATAITTNGDLIYGTGSGTFTRRGIGSTGQVLTVSGGVPTWAAVSAGSWTLAATGSLGTGTSVTISSLSGQKYFVFCHSWSSNGTQPINIRLNGDTGANYYRGDSTSAMNDICMFSSVGITPAASLHHGCFIDMANTSMAFKPVMSTNGVNSTNGSQGGWYNSTSTITSITLFPNGANWDAGTYYVWSFA